MLNEKVKGAFLIDEPMAKHTSYGIGGPVHAYITPSDENDLKQILIFAKDHGINTFFAGSGSNLLVADEGFEGIVITLGKSFTSLNIKDNSVEAQVGVMLGKMVKETIKRNLTGMESMVGVPGTLGGALIMNAGAFGGEISNCLDVIKVMTMDGKIKFYNKNDIGFSYRNSTFPKNEILLSATFALNEKPADEIQFDRARASKGRKESQPLRYRSAGSVFKNPKADLAAGYLIDQAGLKGSRIGDAEISTKHANFFINHGKAKAKDIVGLILLAKKTVLEKFNINLQLEIKTLGFSPGTFEL
ncbi:MAG: UDP-N-acetylmuramate dehydrogenase [Candidatus Neomarinimicrobiota bacterium]|tara:strand:- start:1127 stop:2032 length:906 start_codon:yes stop_codon:yes gene_type:complete